MKNIFFVKTYVNSCLLTIETLNFCKTSLPCRYDETSYNGPSENKRLIFHSFFCINRSFFKLLWIGFSSYLMLRILINFQGHQFQYEQSQNKGSTCVS